MLPIRSLVIHFGWQMFSGVSINSDSYLTESGNKLVKNTENFVGMKSQDGVESQKKTWTIVRSYQAQFSCREAMERLIKIHIDMKEAVSCQSKK